MSVNFDVLMTVYHAERADNLRYAYASILKQTILPKSIIFIIDGPVGFDLEVVIAEIYRNPIVKIIRLEKNNGLGIALQEGLGHCNSDYVIRCDSDDYNEPERFEILFNEIVNAPSNVAVVGSNIYEFNKQSNAKDSFRYFPEYIQYMLPGLRDPVAHPAIIFNKHIILLVGGYQHCLYFEDTYLWLRLIKSGYAFKNVRQMLLGMRVSDGFFNRRSGIAYALKEHAAANLFYRNQLITLSQYFFLGYCRPLFRLLSTRFIKLFYITVLRN